MTVPGTLPEHYRVAEIHSAEELDDEVERMKRSPEMFWWLGLFQWTPITDGLLRTEAYNRLTVRKLK
jgi:hypothetical protein